MPDKCAVGVCIPTRNQAEFVTDAIRSSLEQTVTPCDIVVLDDAGTDDTKTVVGNLRESLPTHLRALLRFERNADVLGIGGNFDRAVRLCRGDFVIKLDSDDILEPTFAEELAKSLQDHPKAGWAHCNVLNISPDGKPLGLAHTRKRSGFYSSGDALPAYLRHNDTCHCVMLRKSAYQSVGGYRPEMKTCEDWLLWLGMLFGGWGYCFNERPLARMRKYRARPGLMTQRRLDFVHSLETMVPHVESACRRRNQEDLGMPTELALSRFRSAVSRLCVSSGCDEANSRARKALFDAAFAVHPSFRNRLWGQLGSRLPAETTRIGTRLKALPRNVARRFVQQLRARTTRGVT